MALDLVHMYICIYACMHDLYDFCCNMLTYVCLSVCLCVMLQVHLVRETTNRYLCKELYPKRINFLSAYHRMAKGTQLHSFCAIKHFQNILFGNSDLKISAGTDGRTFKAFIYK